MTDIPTPPPDAMLPADYRFLKCCGRGAYGAVYLVEDISGRLLVLKRIRRDGDSKLFLRELSGLRTYCSLNLDHPNLIRIHHAAEDEHGFYYTMPPADNLAESENEYIPATLENWLRRTRFTLEEIIYVALALLDGLDELHSRHIAHRDLKPDNVLFINSIPCLSDISLVARVGSGISLVGTFCFLPPELLTRKSFVDSFRPEYDLYAFGKVIYCMFTGLPVENFPILRPIREQPPEPGEQELIRLFNRLCEENPSWRLTSSAEIRKALLHIDELRRSGKKGFSRRKRLWGWSLVGAALLLLAAAGSFAFRRPIPATAVISAAKELPQKSNDTPATPPESTAPRPVSESAFAMYEAIRTGNLQQLNALLDRGVSPNLPLNNERVYYPIHLAVSLEGVKPELISTLIKRGADLSLTDAAGRRALSIAIAKNRSPAVLSPLIEKSGNLNAAEGSGEQRPLHTAVEKQNREAVRILLRAGADPNLPDRLGRTPLFKAVNQEPPAIANLLLSSRADPAIADSSGATPLHILVEDRFLAMQLLHHGAPINARMKDGTTPLLAAVRNRNFNLVRSLLLNGAAVNLADNRGVTPFHAAAINTSCLLILRQHGAEAALNDRRGFLPLHLAVIYGRSDVIPGLAADPLPVNRPDRCGRSPLHWAAIRGLKPVAEQLLSAGANRELRDDRGWSPADLAAIMGHAKLADELRGKPSEAPPIPPLLSSRALPLPRPNTPEEEKALGDAITEKNRTAQLTEAISRCGDLNHFQAGDTPLLRSIRFDNSQAISQLLSAGADPNHKGSDGNYPLLEVIRLENTSLVGRLLAAGADPALPGPEGQSAIQFALTRGAPDLLRHLLDGNSFSPTQIEEFIRQTEAAGNTRTAEYLRTYLKNSTETRVDQFQRQIRAANFSSIRNLLEQGISPNTRLANQEHPLTAVLQNTQLDPQKREKMLRMLLDFGAETEIVNAKGRTPLFLAVESQPPEIVKLLLDFGADTVTPAPDGTSPLTLAEKRQDKTILALLRFYSPKSTSGGY